MGLQIVFVKKKKGCKNFMEMQTDSVETVKSIASDLKAVEPIVSVKNLIVTGKDGRLLVDHLSLQLKRGETLGLVGESGSGKSTLAKVITGLLQADTGRQAGFSLGSGKSACDRDAYGRFCMCVG